VVNVFLPKMVDHDVLNYTLTYGRQYYVGLNAQRFHLPIEFAAGAYRLHSAVRPGYKFNDVSGFRRVFNATDASGYSDMRGGKPLHDMNLELDWRLMFSFADEPVRSLAGRLLDEYVVESLLNLPIPPDYAWIVNLAPISLPVRSIMRGAIYGIPSGEEIAYGFGIRPLNQWQVNWYVNGYYRPDAMYNSSQAYNPPPNYNPYANYTGTPLWYYLQREASIQNNGERLGYVGSIIVAETILGVLQSDPDSYLNAAPGFRPFLYSNDSDNGNSCAQGNPCLYTFQDLLDFTNLRKPNDGTGGS
jgi:hypothetical protein